MKCETYYLGDVCTFIDYRGKTPPKTTSGIPLVTAKIVKNGMIQEPQEFIAESYYDEWMRRGIPKKGSVVFTTEAPLGEVARIRTDDKLAFAQRVIVLEPNTKQLSADYLFYALQDRVLKSRIEARATGTTVIGIKAAELKKVQIDLPSLEEQKKIAMILCSLDDKIELNNKINENLEQQAQAIFKSWFVDFEPFGGTMPSNWKVVSLDTIVDFQNGFAFKSKELLGEPAPNTYRVFKQGHINRGGGFNPDGTKSWYPKESAQQLGKYVLHKGDILMAMTDMKNNVAILGNTAIMPADNEYILNQRVGLLRTKGTHGITYPFIYLLTNSQDFLTDLRSRANSGVQVNLSSTEIKASETVLAPKEINEQFSAIVMPMMEIMLQNQLENERLSQVRDTLLPWLMPGEIHVSNIDL